MKFDFAGWQEFSPAEVVTLESNLCKVVFSRPSALYLVAGPELEVLVGFGVSFVREVAGSTVSFFCDTDEPAMRAFFWSPAPAVRQARMGSFTNPDRADMVGSAAYDAVTYELRRFLQQSRSELSRMQREFVRRPVPAPAPASSPAPVADIPPP